MRAPASAGAVCGAAVCRWAHSPHHSPCAASPHAHALFPHDDHINQRFAIWQGDISSLEVDAIVNTTDETLSESNPVSDRILFGAGAELKEEIVTRAHECAMGEVVVTPGFGLHCDHIIHTVCPKYVAKHHAASESALYNCYKNVLDKANELKVRVLALCIISTPRRNFPPDVAAHVALRAIRGHLQRCAWPALAIVASACAAERALLAELAPLYFPRVADDRRIRIIRNPHTPNSDSVHMELKPRPTAEDDTSLCDEEAAAEAAAAFARACAPDTQRLLGRETRDGDAHVQSARHRLHDHEQYERLLRRARTEDLTEVSGIGCLYQSGVDRLGRPVVVFIGKWFPIADIDLDKALLYLIKLLDPIVRGDYVIAYFHTMASSNNHPPFSWLKEVYTVLPYKYKKNLKAFYIVHPTFWTKMMTWWFTTFMAPAIKAKVHTLPGVEYLYSVMARDQLEVPAFVTEYDMTINGLHYFQPDTNNT